MREDLTLTLDNDEQIVVERLIGDKFRSCTYVMDTKKESELERPDKLKDKIRILGSILDKLGVDKSNPDELNEEDGE